MRWNSWRLWAAAVVAAGLLELPFPLAGPMPPWRSVFAWFGLAPLLWAMLTPECAEGPKPLRRSFLLAYACGVLWYAGNCYWIRDTMMRYGDMPPLAPVLLLAGFSLVLGLYFGLFGLGVALVRRATGSTGKALVAAPVLWAAAELAAARITSVPWDQLGYSQVDNGLVNQLAPWTGVYGISFVLVGVNALLVGGLLRNGTRGRWTAGGAGLALLAAGWAGVLWPVPKAATTATAMLIQPNLDVGVDDTWKGSAWDEHMAAFTQLAEDECKPFLKGIPQTGASRGELDCKALPAHPTLVAWPESPAPFVQADPRFLKSMGTIARTLDAPLVVGGVGMDYSEDDQSWHDFNSAMVVGADGVLVGRYDKIHLVPFGEYVPFQNLLFFARKLTGRVSSFDRGQERKVFRLNGHRYGVFICYEAVFADEVRQFSRLGAEVLVNISDDGWYGDTSAPWQHLNMARMRAVENRRWILRDTNNGVTAAIDPYGRVRQSISRHQVGALPAEFGFRDDVTFYTEHGDVFAWLCAILALGIVGWAFRAGLRSVISNKVRS
ncbi:MAG TPA: apolipoprotein N-acyltransferase [Terracidiphilus sp.]|nr:apolipoprotein N-acyltransferase [Terracidiphilus sp.]